MIRVTLLLLCASLSLSACGGSIPAPEGFKGDPATCFKVFQDRRDRLITLSGELGLELWEGDQRVRARQLFASMPPHKLRMDTLSPFEQPLSTLIMNEEKIALHELEQRRFRVGEPSARNLERLTKLALDPSALSTALSGQPPLIQSAGGALTWDARRGLYKLTLIAEDALLADREELWLKHPEMTVSELRLYRRGELTLRMQLTDYTSFEPRIPQRMRFELPQSKIRVEVKLKDFALNPDLPEEAFLIEPPFGLRPEPL